MSDQELLLPTRRAVHSGGQRWLTALLFIIAVTALAHSTKSGDSYVLRDDGVTYMLGEGMSSQALKELQARYGAQFLWARRQSHIYIFRDRKTLTAARAVIGRNIDRNEQEKAMAVIVDDSGRSGNAEPEAYMLVTPDGSISNGGDMNVEEMKALKAAYGSNVFWFRSGGQEYIVRDESALKTIGDLFRPQWELGMQQAALGEKQSALGMKQASLGEKQAQLGARQASIGGRDSAAQNELSRMQNELGNQQNELGKAQNALGEQQNVLGRKQNELSRKIVTELARVAADLLRKGLAQPAHR